MANEAGAKAYVRSLSLSLHEELKSDGIHVTVLPPAGRISTLCTRPSTVARPGLVRLPIGVQIADGTGRP